MAAPFIPRCFRGRLPFDGFLYQSSDESVDALTDRLQVEPEDNLFASLVDKHEDELVFVKSVILRDTHIWYSQNHWSFLTDSFCNVDGIGVATDVDLFPTREQSFLSDECFFVLEIQHNLFARQTSYYIAEEAGCCLLIESIKRTPLILRQLSLNRWLWLFVIDPPQ